MSPSNDWGITLTAKDVTPTGLTLEITQSGGTYRGELLTGTWYVVKRWTDDGQPEILISEPVVWADVGISIPSNDTLQMDVDWSRLYGELPPGQYRIGKEMMDVAEPGDFDRETYYAVFSIPDT